ncbi:MAG: thiolase domain-containing protein [Thermoplasmata archaeon]|nr:thiolase domain-containing protein [Thermoplasmata archaeon]
MTVRVTATAVGRFGKRPEGLVDLLEEAGALALESLGRRPIDYLVIGSMAAGSLGASENLVGQVADRLGLESAEGMRVDAASASGAAAFQLGAMIVTGRRADRVLVLAGEKMTGVPSADVAAALARSLAPSERAVGATMPGLAALVAHRYLARYGGDAGIFDEIAAAFRTNGSRNPNAQFQAPVTSTEVAQGRWVAPPLRLLHCSAVSDGAAAAVLERTGGSVAVAGFGQGIDSLALCDRLEITGFLATQRATRRAYEMAGITRKSIEVAEIHDAFAPFALIDLEDLGFCGPGEAEGLWRSGVGARDGILPLNPSGGLLGRGHPVGASGLAGIVEVVRQIEGEAGPTEIPRRPRCGLAQSIGGLGSHNFVTVLSSEVAG